MCSLTVQRITTCGFFFQKRLPKQGKHIQTYSWTHVPPPDALHCAAEWKSQVLSKNGLTPSPELRGIQLPRVHLLLPSPPVPWLYGCTLPRKDTRGHVDPADTMPKPTQGRRKGVFLCQQTCSTHQATSEHP